MLLVRYSAMTQVLGKHTKHGSVCLFLCDSHILLPVLCIRFGVVVAVTHTIELNKTGVLQSTFTNSLHNAHFRPRL